MALTTYTKNATATTGLNSGTVWVGGSAPPSAVTSQARWDSTVTTGISNPLGASTTWGQLSVTNPGGACTIASTTSTSLTLTPTDAGAAGVGIDMSAATQNFTIAAAVTLGSSQTWTVASGRTLTVTGVITGAARDVTFSGAGTIALNTGINNGTWTGSKLTLSSGTFVTTNANRTLGSTTNTVEVLSGGAIYIALLNTASVNAFTVAGSGVAGKQAGAIFIAGAADFSAGKTITLKGASPVIGVLANQQAGTILDDGTLTGDVTFNVIGANSTAGTFTNTSSFTVSAGNRVILQGVNPVGAGTPTAADFAIEATDGPGLGNANNDVSVKSTLRLVLISTAGVTALSRDYFFEGESGSGTPASPNTYSIAPIAGLNSVHTFSGTITGTPNYWVKANTSGGSSLHTLKFNGTFQGSWNFKSFSSTQIVYLDPALNISGWTGNIELYRVSYGVAPVGAATYTGGGTIDNISGAPLTLQHSSYAFGTTITFAGTNELTFGTGSVTTGISFTATVSASKVTFLTSITGTGGSQFIKTGAGAMALGGAVTAYTAYQHQGGTLFLNNAAALGNGSETFTLSASFANTVDAETNVTLNNTGIWNASADFTWGGSADLFVPDRLVHTTNRIITFVAGKSGTLRFSRWQTTTASTQTLNVGGSATGTKSRLYFTGASTTNAASSSVTAGYLKIGNNDSLGNPAITASWTVASGGCIELDGVTTPNTKNGASLVGDGPTGTSHGVLRSTSITTPSEWRGSLVFTNVAGGRITTAPATTLTLSDVSYLAIEGPTGSSCPLNFDAGISATLNVNRRFASTIGAVTCGQAGSGRVILARANQHTGKLICSSGETILTEINAAGPAATGAGVDVNEGATLAVEVASTYKAIFPGTTKLGSNTSIPASKAIFRIGA